MAGPSPAQPCSAAGGGGRGRDLGGAVSQRARGGRYRELGIAAAVAARGRAGPGGEQNGRVGCCPPELPPRSCPAGAEGGRGGPAPSPAGAAFPLCRPRSYRPAAARESPTER